MKRFSYLFMAGLMTLGLWSCSDDANLTPDGGDDQISGDVYMSFKLELPTAGRSATDEVGETNSNANPDFEVGQEVENTVKRFDVVLVVKDPSKLSGYKYIAQTSKTESTAQNIYTNEYTVKFQSQALEDYEGQSVVAFVFCNHPGDTNYKGIVEGTNPQCVLPNNDAFYKLSAKDGFWMSNSKIPAEVELKNLDQTSERDPLTLGTVEVERTVARFDFKHKEAGNIDLNSDGTKDKDVYVLEGTEENPGVVVQLAQMALLNVSNQFNYVRHTDNPENPKNEYEKGSVAICGVEKNTNFVVDSDFEQKLANDYLPNNFLNYWDEGAGNKDIETPIHFASLWNTVSSTASNIATLETPDNWTDKSITENNGYMIWKYATENTLPSVVKQIKSLSTAVVFKGYLYDLNVTNNRLSGDKAYVLNNKLYGSWSQVGALVASVTDTSTEDLIALKAAYNAAGGAGAPEPNLSTASEYGFTVFEKDKNNTIDNLDDDYWPVYYYYINKHNDNGQSEVMGPMEFAVVRNNIYKLAVTKINKFGHPGDPAGDPDPEIPSEPDESKNVYFQVNVKVVPWTVRVNNIEF